MGSKKHLTLRGLRKKFLGIYKPNKEKVFDIVAFGSFVKGKEFAGDIDIAIVFREAEDLAVLNLARKISGRLHIDYLLLPELYVQPLWKSLIREGHSLVHNKRLSEMLGFRNYGLYAYDLGGLGSRKARFSQVLSGYKSESMLKKCSGTVMGRGVVLVPIEKVEIFREFLDAWKVRYRLKYIYME